MTAEANEKIQSNKAQVMGLIIAYICKDAECFAMYQVNLALLATLLHDPSL